MSAYSNYIALYWQGLINGKSILIWWKIGINDNDIIFANNLKRINSDRWSILSFKILKIPRKKILSKFMGLIMIQEAVQWKRSIDYKSITKRLQLAWNGNFTSTLFSWLPKIGRRIIRFLYVWNQIHERT